MMVFRGTECRVFQVILTPGGVIFSRSEKDDQVQRESLWCCSWQWCFVFGFISTQCPIQKAMRTIILGMPHQEKKKEEEERRRGKRRRRSRRRKKKKRKRKRRRRRREKCLISQTSKGLGSSVTSNSDTLTEHSVYKKQYAS